MPEELSEVVVAETEPEVEVDDFSEAFNKAVEAAEVQDAAEPIVEAKVEPTELKAEEKEESKDEIPEETKPIEETKPPEEDWKHKYDTLNGMFKKQAEELKVTKAKIPEPKKEEPPPQEEDPEVTEFLTEFDYLAKPIQKIVEKLVSQKAGEVESKSDAKVQATNRMVADLMISAQHPDFFELRETGEIRKWVDTLPETEKEVYTRVCNEGSIKEVVDLISDYKKTVKSPLLEEQKQKEAEKQNKITNLAAVKRKPGAINSSSGKVDDFNSAFAKRAAELEQRR